MNRIRLLAENVANQIAAGEVIERPASAVKELVENAIDAQAGRIVVEIQAGGRSLIRVTDDGIGMAKDDALMAFERHATSKIVRAEDLHSIHTMGFRGEALPSIASVSRLTLTTRQQESDAPDATQVIIHGGKIQAVKAAGAPSGTSVEVRNLYFNLPARRKFLRSEETERAHVQHYLVLAALANPHIAMTFIANGRTLWQLPSQPASADQGVLMANLQERMKALYGGDLHLLPAFFETALQPPRFRPPPDEDAIEEMEPTTMRVWGLIGAPGVSRATRENQHLFVNKRPIENRGLNHALLEGYHNSLMKGRFPVCCLFLDLDPRCVDVNIHPAKREVKFHPERDVRWAVAQAVRKTLLSFHTGQQPSPFNKAGPAAVIGTAPEVPNEKPAAGREHRERSEQAQQTVPLGLSCSGRQPSSTSTSKSVAPPVPAEQNLSVPHQSAFSPDQDAAPGSMESQGASDRSAAFSGGAGISQTKTSSNPRPLLSIDLRIVGVVGRLYVVMESDQGLVLMDQHAAHERVLYEQMLKRLDKENAPSQRLLLPETIELPPKDAQFLRENLEQLTRLGVGLSEFGERTFLFDALPAFVRNADARNFVRELLDELKVSGEDINNWRLGENVVAKTVCRHAVKANDPLKEEELGSLLESLRQCEMPYTCPHGRPTLIEMNFRDLEKKFGRVH